MEIPKKYLETTIYSFFYADDASDKKKTAIVLFNRIKGLKYILFIFHYVIGENIIPRNHETDVRHIVATAIYDLGFILSYNLKHTVFNRSNYGRR
jgi:hypothetical protein